jgi:two-component system response regulator YesN
MNKIHYPNIEIGKLQSVLSLFNYYTGIEVCLLNESAEICQEIGKNDTLNKRLENYLPDPDVFIKARIDALTECARLGDIYDFLCDYKLNFLIYPINTTKAISGGIMAGPFYRYEEIKKNPDELLKEIPILDEKSIEKARQLLYYLMGDVVSGYKDIMLVNQKRIMHQTRISKALENYNLGGYYDSKDYPFEAERILLTAIRSGDLEASKKAYNEFVLELRDFTNNELQVFKNYSIQLCGIIAHFVIQKGADSRKLLKMVESLVASINKTDSFEESSFLISDNLEIFTNALYHSEDKSNRIIRDVSEYIALHYSEDISLITVAEKVNLNPSYLSRLFNQVTKMSFKDYLNKIRIDESLRLLSYSDHSILDVAISCGFNDQSYYSRVFKKIMGMTPRQYREESAK